MVKYDQMILWYQARVERNFQNQVSYGVCVRPTVEAQNAKKIIANTNYITVTGEKNVHELIISESKFSDIIKREKMTLHSVRTPAFGICLCIQWRAFPEAAYKTLRHRSAPTTYVCLLNYQKSISCALLPHSHTKKHTLGEYNLNPWRRQGTKLAFS